MRQAGRSLPEYRALRERFGLFEICAQPELCAEVTLQPVRAHGVDAAVMFADIMLPVLGMGVEVELVESVGPVVADPISSLADVERLVVPDPEESVAPSSPRVLSAVDVPTIHFGTGTAHLLRELAAAGGDVIGVDWRVPIERAWAEVGPERGVQGNLDPALLLGPFERVRAEVLRILEAVGARPGHGFNLGHGVLP